MYSICCTNKSSHVTFVHVAAFCYYVENLSFVWADYQILRFWRNEMSTPAATAEPMTPDTLDDMQ